MRHSKLIIVLAAFLVCWWVAWPALQYKNATSENVNAEVVAEPFITGNELVYRWTGDVVRSCPVTIRRTFIDSEGVVTDLVAESFTALPSGELGRKSFEISIRVPKKIAAGPASYQAFEIPHCSWMQRLFPISIPYPPVAFTVTR